MRLGTTGFNKKTFLDLFQAAREKTFQPRSIRNSFRACGYIPFNPKVVLSKLPNYDTEGQTSSLAFHLASPDVTTDTIIPPNQNTVQKHTQQIISYIDQLSCNEIEIDPNVRIQVMQLGEAAEVSMAKESIQREVSSQLRAANHVKKQKEGGDRRVLSKARVLGSEEAEELKKAADEKEKVDAEQKARSDVKKDAKKMAELLRDSPLGGLYKAEPGTSPNKSLVTIDISSSTWMEVFQVPEAAPQTFNGQLTPFERQSCLVQRPTTPPNAVSPSWTFVHYQFH